MSFENWALLLPHSVLKLANLGGRPQAPSSPTQTFGKLSKSLVAKKLELREAKVDSISVGWKREIFMIMMAAVAKKMGRQTMLMMLLPIFVAHVLGC